jgi:hypothetical protein
MRSRIARLVALMVPVILVGTIFLPVVSAESTGNFGKTVNVDVQLNPGMEFSNNDQTVNLANESQIKTEYDLWSADWGVNLPKGILYGSPMPPTLYGDAYEYPQYDGTATATYIQMFDYFTFPKSVMMTGAWKWWVKIPMTGIDLAQTQENYIKVHDQLTNETSQCQDVVRAGDHLYALFYLPVFPDHLYQIEFKYEISPLVWPSCNLTPTIELAQDAIYDMRTDLIISEYHGPLHITSSETMGFEPDWSFIFLNAIGEDGLFGMVVNPDINGFIHLRKYCYDTGSDSFLQVFLPFVSNHDVEIEVTSSGPYDDIPLLTVKNGYYASTDFMENWTTPSIIHVSIYTPHQPLTFLCSAQRPDNNTIAVNIHDTVNLTGITFEYLTVYLSLQVDQSMIGTVNNMGNSTTIKIVDTGYSKFIVLTEQKIYVRYGESVVSFIMNSTLYDDPNKVGDGIVEQILRGIGNIIQGLWDGVTQLVGAVWTTLMKIGEFIVGFAKWIVGVITSFIHTLILWLGDVVHNLTVIFYAIMFIVPPLGMMFGISYGSRALRIEEE